MQAPQQRAGIQKHHEGNQDSAEKLHLGVNPAGTQVVGHGGVEAAESKGLKDVDAADGQPAHKQHQQNLDNLVNLAQQKGRNPRYKGQNNPLRSCLTSAQELENEVVNCVAEDDNRRKEKDRIQPILP